ncbi:DUF1622 domain-containing protein [Polymorphospora rubra]|uniref:DUF1622 domain-containing protein n=1 Tax=Polymorphospora rubra TaxID=338584 RepID=UPI001BB325EF|nr:DUF1622 domain-containing protein [Polymorphospora rubra]
MKGVFGERWLAETVNLLELVVEAAGALIIFTGAMVALVRFVAVGVRKRRSAAFVPVRLSLGRFLTLGLEFQLAADILRTAIAPTLGEIAQLAAIAAIRTALNFFLGREIKEERKELAGAGRDQPAGPADTRRAT